MLTQSQIEALHSLKMELLAESQSPELPVAAPPEIHRDSFPGPDRESPQRPSHVKPTGRAAGPWKGPKVLGWSRVKVSHLESPMVLSGSQDSSYRQFLGGW